MRHFAAKFDQKNNRWRLPTRLDIIQRLEEYGAELTQSVEPILAELNEKQKALNESKLSGMAEDQSMPIKTTPFQHQQVAFKVATQLDASALLMEQGTGKTLTAIAVAGKRLLSDGVQFLLVICPASVVAVWPREFKEHADYPFDVTPVIANTATAKMDLILKARDRSRPGQLTVVVINFESAWRIESALEPVVKGQMIVVDESQRIKTPSAAQSKCLHRLGRLAKYRMILSGTPITQNPLDLYSQYKFLEPSLFGNSFTVFRNRYAIMGGFEGRQVVGYQHLDDLMAKAHSIAYRVTKHEALDLPSETTMIRPVTLPKKVAEVYNRLKRESIVELEQQAQTEKVVAVNVLTKLLRLQQVCGGFVQSDDGNLLHVHNEKLDILKDELDSLLEDETRKVVIFARFLPEIKAINALLAKMKIGYRHIVGAINQAERGDAVQAFQSDPSVKVFVAQIATAGLGITLTAADTAIFYSMDFSLANHEQAKARIHRIGQRHPVTYMYLIAEQTVDAKIFDALKSKKSIADMVVDDWRSVL